MNEEMRTWFEQRLPPNGKISKGRRVYLTRSRLGPRVGRYCNEAILERILATDGFEIVAPERLHLCDQLALFQDAEILLFAESSALHLYGLVAREGQRAAVIQRRRELPSLMEGQFHKSRVKLNKIDAISSVFWPPRRQDNSSIATLDFDRLRERLIELGFLSSDSKWRAPHNAEVFASLRAGLSPTTQLIPDEKRRDWLREQRRKRY
jgi:hypothetical protein